MPTAKERARTRFGEMWRQRTLPNVKKQQELDRRASIISTTLRTSGWKEIIEVLDKNINKLREDLENTAAFRVFKCLEIKSDIRAYRKLYVLMKTEERVKEIALLKE